jgi:hypothetical protein
MSEHMSDQTPSRMPNQKPDRMPEEMSDRMPDNDRMSEFMSVRMLAGMSDKMVQYLSK